MAQWRRPQCLSVLRLIGVARCSKGQGGLSGEAQWAVSLDGELRSVAAELLVVLDDVCIRRSDTAGIVYVIVFDFCLLTIAGGARSTRDGLVVVGNVCLIVNQIRVLPLNDVWFRVPFWLFPYCHVIAIWWDVIWVIKCNILATLLLFLLLLFLRFLLLRFLWHFGLVAGLAVVAQDQTEDHQGKNSGTAANDSRHCPDGEDHSVSCRAGAADKPSVVGCFADSTLRALDAQTGHQSLTGFSCVELRADTSKSQVRVWHTAAIVLAGIRSTVARRDTLVCVPLVDAHQSLPAWVALTQVRTSAANLD